MISTTRHLPVPKAPGQVQNLSAEQVVELLNKRWKELETLSVTVEVQATSLKTQEGVARDYTAFPANILLHTPGKLRVYGRVPVLKTELFDMSSDGQLLTMYIPSQKKAYKGSATLHKKSTNPYLNMRPGFFIDALAVRGLEPDELYTVTSVTDTLVDAQKKHLVLVPEYVLSIMRPEPGTHKLIPVRVITFHRDDMLPYEQDIYNASGELETHVSYQGYADFGNGLYPSTVTIKRPLDEKQIVLAVDKVTMNMPLSEDQFQAKVPSGIEVQPLE